jgi:hypothetical protein
MSSWPAVERLIDRSGSLGALRFHKLSLLAAHRYRALGLPVTAELAEEEAAAAAKALAAPLVLQRARACLDGACVLLKGPEIAARYPDPALRGSNDLDLLVADPLAAFDALVSGGFEPVGEHEVYRDIHHLRPLTLPELGLPLELHSRPKWIAGLEPPPTPALIASAVPAAVGVAGISALPRAHHALITAVHAWAHEPLWRLGDLLDVQLLAEDADQKELRRLAREWGIGRLWDTTHAAITALFDRGSRPLALRTWARHLPLVRERTVLEHHLERLLSPFGAFPPGQAVRRAATAAIEELRPLPGEPWRAKARRTVRAAGDMRTEISSHDRRDAT